MHNTPLGFRSLLNPFTIGPTDDGRRQADSRWKMPNATFCSLVVAFRDICIYFVRARVEVCVWRCANTHTHLLWIAGVRRYIARQGLYSLGGGRVRRVVSACRHGNVEQREGTGGKHRWIEAAADAIVMAGERSSTRPQSVPLSAR